MSNVLVVVDNGPIRKSLRHLIDTADDIEIVASATNGVEAVEKADSYRPDIAVMDISMPLMDGIEAIEHIRQCCTLTRVIILSSFNDPEHIRQAWDVGAKGYVLKDRAANDLLEGIRCVHEGKPYFSQQIAEIAESHLLRGENDSRAPAANLGA
jgi:DNA-binding NarL/FixJ family response regulator